MRHIIALCAVHFFVFTVVAQQNVKTVLDADQGNPLSEVYVYDSNGTFIVQSNTDGKIFIPDSVSTIINLTKNGYKGLYYDLSHSHGDTILLSRYSQILDEVAIVWQSSYLGLPTFANIDARSVDQLMIIPHSNLMQSLNEIPGVYTSNTGSGISKPVIRGLQGTRILTLFNGYKMEGQQWGGDHGLGITELGVQNVSVIKGPSALLYGADAIGGVLLFNDGFQTIKEGYKLNVSSQFETNTMGTTTNVFSEQRKGKWAWQAGGRFTSTADYSIGKKQYVKNSRYQEYNAKAGLGYFGAKWETNVQFFMTNNQIGLPGHTHGNDYSPAQFLSSKQERTKTLPVQYNQQYFTIWNTKVNLSDRDVLAVTTGFTSQTLKEHDEKYTIPSMSMLTQNIPLQVMLHHSKKRSMLTVGVQSMWNSIRNKAEAEEILIPNADQIDLGLVGKMQWDRSKWKTEFGVRADMRSIKTADFGKNYFGANLGWNNTLQFRPKQSLKIGLNSGFRIPHLSELLAHGIHHGTFRYEIGNSNLKPEKALQLDVSYDYKDDHFSFIVNPYLGVLNDFIYTNPTGSNIDGFPVFNYEQVNLAWQYGADIGFHYHPHFAHSLHLESTFSYLNYTSKAQAFSMIPAPRWSSSLRFEPNMKGIARIENILFQFVYSLPQKNVVEFEIPTVDYGVFNFSLNTGFGKKDQWKVQLAVRNIFNKQYIDHLSRLKNFGLSNPGRNVIVKLIYNI